MHKLIILIEPPDDPLTFDARWPEFLRLAEGMPGLVREAIARVEDLLFGSRSIYMIHELFFENRPALDEAMTSPKGQAAGRTLQALTNGRMTLLVAEHQEDDLENLRRYTIGQNVDAQ